MATKAEKLKELLELNGGSSDGHTIGEVLTDFVEFMGGTTDDVSVNGIIDDMKSLKLGGGSGVEYEYEYSEQTYTSLGITATAQMPNPFTSSLTITEKNVSDLELDTDIYFLGDKTAAYDVNFMFGGQGHNPNTDGATVKLVIPASKIPVSTGEQVSIYAKNNDGETITIGPILMSGSQMDLTMEVFSNGEMVFTNPITSITTVNKIFKFRDVPAYAYVTFYKFPNAPVYQIDDISTELEVSHIYTLANGEVWYYLSQCFFDSDFSNLYFWIKADDVVEA